MKFYWTDDTAYSGPSVIGGLSDIEKLMVAAARNARAKEIPLTALILGGFAALAIAVAMVVAVSNDTTQTASNSVNRPNATKPAAPSANPPSTTGSRATSR